LEFLALCHRHGFAEPEVNAKIGDIEIDFLWRERNLVVETDGYRYHRGRVAFEGDRNRDLKLKALGYDVIRLSYRQVCETPAEVAGALRNVLGAL
jgi:very-short-patch-repair endonuclease